MKIVSTLFLSIVAVLAADQIDLTGTEDGELEVLPAAGTLGTYGCDMSADRDADILFMVSAFGPYSDLRVIYSWQYNAVSRVNDWLANNGHELHLSVFELNDYRNEKCIARSLINTSISEWNDIRRTLPGADLYFLDVQKDEAANVMAWYAAKVWSGSVDTSKVRRLTVFYTHKAPHFGTVGDFVPDVSLTGFDSHCPVSETALLTQRQFVENVRSLKTGLFIYVAPRIHSKVEPVYRAWTDLVESEGLNDALVLHRGNTIEWTTSSSQRALENLLCPSWIATTSTAVPTFSESAKRECLDTHRPCGSGDEKWMIEVGKCLYN